MRAQSERKITVALAGNPNVGKSTVFNALTGLHQHTGNWPGKTVGIATGSCRHKGIRYDFVDLPGTYSLNGASQDQRIASDYIAADAGDCTVVVCDGSALERSLILALQILQRTPRAVVCVNLMDEAERRGFRVDREALEEEIGVRVVLAAAGRRRGLRQLLDAISQTVWEGDGRCRPTGENVILEAERIAARCVLQVTAADYQKKMDKIFLSRRFGIPIMLALLLIIIWLTVWGANYPSRLLERLFDAGYGALQTLTALWPGWLRGLLVDGMYATSARVIAVMLPPMAIFFPLFTVLEDVGYLPRMAFLLDRSMSRCGGCGKQALTLCMGLGCNAVGVMGCRIIDSPRERLLAILTNAFVPCNGRFPTLIILGSLFFPDGASALVVALCVVMGVLMAMAVSGTLSKTTLRHEKSIFLLELPPYRKPQILQILVRSLLDRTLHIAGRALMVAAPAGLLLWLLNETGVLQHLAALLDPVGRLLGMSGVILMGFVFSLPANELLIPVILMIATGSHLSAVSGEETLLAGITWQTALCTMVFTLFHWPCSTTLITVYKETGSMKKTAAAFLLPTAVGVVICFFLNGLLRYFCG